MNIDLRIPYAELCNKIVVLLTEADIPEQRARLEAQIMAEADLLEVPSHGVKMLPGLLTALAEGRIFPAPEVKTERDLGAICVVDFGNGPGRFAASTAMNMAMQKAEQFGVGVCLAKRASHWGRAHAYANQAAQAGYIGICTTNAVPSMAIWGAKSRVIGNNPLAIGVPRNDASEPVVLDIAMSQAAVGKVRTWLREGKPLPNNWGVDAQGNPSSDANAILAGAVSPMGEHKGAGLALMIELLTAALAGAAFSHQIRANDPSGIDPESSKLFIALNVNAFIDPQEFTEGVDEFLSYLKNVAAPFQYPSERGWQAKRNNLIAGVPLHPEIVEELRQVGMELS